MSHKVDAQKCAALSMSSSSSSSPTCATVTSVCSPHASLKRTRLVDINAGLTCILCNGYFIDAVTIIECLHSFCKSCIVQYLEVNKCCPICEVQVHKTKPLLNIRSDKALQDIVYKLIPDVFKNEMQRRRNFYTSHPEAMPTSVEDRGELSEHKMFYMPHDKISLSLEYGYGDNQTPDNGYRSATAVTNKKGIEAETMRRYLLCPAGLSILHLKKFIVTKYALPSTYKVDIMYLQDILSEDYTLMDVAYIYAWRRSDPMRLFYRICERPIKRLKVSHPQTVESKSGSSASNSNLNNNVTKVSQTEPKLTASTSTSTSSNSTGSAASSTIMTGAATLSLSNSANNSKASGVTSSKGSAATPKNADTISASAVNAYRVSPSPTAATPQGISKSIHKSVVCSSQTGEPPKKLRKILPNTTTTPKPVPKHVAVSVAMTCASSTASNTTSTTSSSTVHSLRQCRINTDKNKCVIANIDLGCNARSAASDANAGSNANSNANSNGSKNAINASNGLSEKEVKSATPSACSGGSVNKKNSSSRKSSSFDVRTLIGTKSPPHSYQTPSAISGNEYKNESGINNSKGISGVRELNRNTVSSSCSMPSGNGSMAATGESALDAHANTTSTSRPPNSADKVTSSACVTSRPFVPIKITKSGTFVSPKQFNAKSLRASQSDISVGKSSSASTNTNTNANSHKDIKKADSGQSKTSNKSITNSKCSPQSNKPHKQSNPLSPPSIRIKLPTLPSKTSTQSVTSLPNKITTSSSMPSNSVNKVHTLKNASTHQTKQSQFADERCDRRASDRDNSDNCLSKERAEEPEKWEKCGKSELQTQCQSSKSSISHQLVSKASQAKGASINQIVNKIASGVTAKSANVNVTSTTPTLELTKCRASASSKVSANEVNDDKVSTTTNESGVSSSVPKTQDESAIKAVSSATTNTGNLVIRISTKSALVESSANKLKDRNADKFNKFQIKRETNSNAKAAEHVSKCAANASLCADKSVKIDTTLNESPNSNSNTISALQSYKSNANPTNGDNNSNNNDNNDGDDDDDDNSIDGRKLIVDVPNDEGSEGEVGTSKVTLELDDIDSGRGSDIIRLSCDDLEIGSPQSTTLSIKTPESDASGKQAANLCSTTTISVNSAVLASPPPTPTPSPKSEIDVCDRSVSDHSNQSSKSASLSSPSNGPLDLSTTKKSSVAKSAIPASTLRAIYDIPPPKPKHCVNPAVLDKHRGLFATCSAPNKQHPSFKIMPNTQSSPSSRPSQSSLSSPASQPSQSSQSSATPSPASQSSTRKERSASSMLSSSTGTNQSTNQTNQSTNQSSTNHNRNHHHHHHHNHKTYSVITPDPHRYTPKIVIRNIGSPPSISSHFNYHPSHR